MLILDLETIGKRLYAIRKKAGLTQAEVAEAAGLSDRTYADIERGSVNMRTETILRICEALQITPNEIFTNSTPEELHFQETFDRLAKCKTKEQQTALRLISVYLDSLS
ncbi:MAG: helix-turn-helix transcriptional regulator [Clostridia bacterium]|nr:helix-turn-helix transcriptional regulator [Clostridia bacterium]